MPWRAGVRHPKLVGTMSFPVSRRVLCPLVLASLACAVPIEAQEATPDSVTQPANLDYPAGGVWEFIWGTDYRQAWATPVTVPVLDLEAFAGGLTPLRRGGGLQTRSLRFAGADGREYSFRSINKDPTAVLPDELKTSVAADVVQDQISAQHPYGALVADSILTAVGVLHAKPVLYAMPDDPDAATGAARGVRVPAPQRVAVEAAVEDLLDVVADAAVDRGELRRVRKLGAGAYLIKPVPLGMLAKAIRDELDSVAAG